jgi:acetoacetyl-CoA reductase
MKKQHGRLDILVNNAAIIRDHSFRRMTAQEWREVIDTDLTALTYTCHFAVPMLLENGWAELSTSRPPPVNSWNYAAAKAGVIGFTKALAVELARNNITVNVVAIGAMATEIWHGSRRDQREALREDPDAPRLHDRRGRARSTLLGRRGAYITGHALNINGGIYQG